MSQHTRLPRHPLMLRTKETERSQKNRHHWDLLLKPRWAFHMTLHPLPVLPISPLLLETYSRGRSSSCQTTTASRGNTLHSHHSRLFQRKSVRPSASNSAYKEPRTTQKGTQARRRNYHRLPERDRRTKVVHSRQSSKSKQTNSLQRTHKNSHLLFTNANSPLASTSVPPTGAKTAKGDR